MHLYSEVPIALSHQCKSSSVQIGDQHVVLKKGGGRRQIVRRARQPIGTKYSTKHYLVCYSDSRDPVSYRRGKRKSYRPVVVHSRWPLLLSPLLLLPLVAFPCYRHLIALSLPSYCFQGIKERPVSVLASCDSGGVVVLSCGALKVMTIDLRCHRTSGPPKGKGKTSSDSPVQGTRKRPPVQHRRSGGDVNCTGTGPGLRPLQLTLSADLSLLSAIVEVDGHIELIQVTAGHIAMD